MKIKFLFASLIATIAVCACVEENPISQFSGIEYSNDYVTIPAEGGSAEVTITAQEDWTVKLDEKAVDWLTVNPDNGKAGETVTIHFSAKSANATRKASVSIVTASKTKIITVNQEGDPNAVTSCKEIVDEGVDGTKYRIRGTVTLIVNTNYGNFYVNDGTLEDDGLYVYGVKNDKDQYPKDADGGWESFGVEVGDIVVVEGPRKVYNGTVELVDATIVSVSKGTTPMLVCEESDVVVGASETAASFDITAKNLTGKWTVTKDAESTWVKSFTPEGTESGKIEIQIEANEGDERTATFTVRSDGANDLTLTLKQGKYSAVGTLDKPYTVAGIIEALKAGPVAGNVYVKGIVSNTTNYNFGGEKQYNTASFWISDDGVYNDDLNKDFEAYSVYYLGGSLDAPTAGADIKANFKVGDEVILYGAVTAYTKNDVTTYETSSKKAKLYSINWATSDENGVGNVDYPFNVAGAEKFIDDTQAALTAAKAAGETLNLPDVAVKGKISAVLFTYDATHNTGSFWISDDGTAYGVSDDKKSTSEPTKDFECYSVYMFGIDAPWTEGTYPQPAVGDDVIVKGQLTVYKGTYETSSKKAWIYSLNGVTSVAAE